MFKSTTQHTEGIEPEEQVCTRQEGTSRIQQVEVIILHFYFVVIDRYDEEKEEAMIVLLFNQGNSRGSHSNTSFMTNDLLFS